LSRADVRGSGGRGSEGEVETVAGQVRASIRLSPEAAAIWLKLDKAGRVRLGALFNEMVVWYGVSGKLPVSTLSEILKTAEYTLRWLETCERQVSKAAEEAERLRRELEEARAKLRSIQELEAKLREAEAATTTLKEELSATEAKLKQCNERTEHYRRWVERLAQTLCPHLDKLKTTIGDHRATVELESLCWRRREAQT
jgi:septal ring factor EnvC (AmiA/AmiB activator)